MNASKNRYELCHDLKILYAKHISTFSNEDKKTIHDIIDLIESYLDFK